MGWVCQIQQIVCQAEIVSYDVSYTVFCLEFHEAHALKQ